jgi:hypothetical protein
MLTIDEINMIRQPFKEQISKELTDYLVCNIFRKTLVQYNINIYIYLEKFYEEFNNEHVDYNKKVRELGKKFLKLCGEVRMPDILAFDFLTFTARINKVLDNIMLEHNYTEIIKKINVNNLDYVFSNTDKVHCIDSNHSHTLSYGNKFIRLGFKDVYLINFIMNEDNTAKVTVYHFNHISIINDYCVSIDNKIINLRIFRVVVVYRY